jgi:hypothetical protein
MNVLKLKCILNIYIFIFFKILIVKNFLRQNWQILKASISSHIHTILFILWNTWITYREYTALKIIYCAGTTQTGCCLLCTQIH